MPESRDLIASSTVREREILLYKKRPKSKSMPMCYSASRLHYIVAGSFNKDVLQCFPSWLYCGWVLEVRCVTVLPVLVVLWLGSCSKMCYSSSRFDNTVAGFLPQEFSQMPGSLLLFAVLLSWGRGEGAVTMVHYMPDNLCMILHL